MSQSRMIAWADVAGTLLDSDLLLFCDDASPATSEPIRVGGQSRAYHVGTFCWRRDHKGRRVQALCLEMASKVGGRAYPLKQYVEDYPGTIVAYRPDAMNVLGYNRRGCVEYFWSNFLGKPYGDRTIWRFLRNFAVLLRWFFRPSLNDDQRMRNPVCSTSRAACDRHGGGIDPVPNRSDNDTSPGDLERSALYTKLGMLVPDRVKSGTDATLTQRQASEEQLACLGITALGLLATGAFLWIHFCW